MSTHHGWRRVLAVIGIFVAVWLSLRYLYPLFLPFLLGLALALAAEPLAKFFCDRLRWRRRPAVFAAVTGVLALMAALGTIIGSLIVRRAASLAGSLSDLAGRAAAGLTTARIREMAGVDCPVARIMPNTPAASGAGVIQLCHTGLTEVELCELTELLSGAGLVDLIDEERIDAACAVSGCGPAFAYMFLDALAQGGEACGLPRDKALLYATKMLEGAAKLAAQSDNTPEELKQAVCSPGGATIQGVYALENANFAAAVQSAVKASYKRTLELK